MGTPGGAVSPGVQVEADAGAPAVPRVGGGEFEAPRGEEEAGRRPGARIGRPGGGVGRVVKGDSRLACGSTLRV